MIRIEILNVKRQAELSGDDASFKTANGTLYKSGWVCEVEVDGEREDNVLITAGGKDPDKEPYCARYMEAGGVVCSKKRIDKQGHSSYYLDSKATKEENGDSYNGGGGSGGSSGGSSSGGSGGSAPAGKYESVEEVTSVIRECYEILSGIEGIEPSDLASMTSTAAIECFRNGVKAGAVSAAPPASGGEEPPAGVGDDGEEGLPF